MRNALLLGALVVVGALLWVVTAWPAPEDEPEPASVPVYEPAPPPPAAPPAAAPAPTAPKPAEPTAPPPPPPAAAPTSQAEPAQPADGIDPASYPTDMFLEDQGPVAELRSAYEREPRDSAASGVETELRASFAHADGAPDLFKSVLCRQTVCRIEMRWAPDRIGAYVAGMTRSSLFMDPAIAVSPVGPFGPDKTKPIHVFVRRKQPTAAKAEAE